MPFYHRLGEIPQKRHTQYRKPDGSLYAEELISTEGFSNILSLVYHCHPPTLVKDIEDPIDKRPKYVVENNLRHRSFLNLQYENQRQTMLRVVLCLWVIVICWSPLQRQLQA